MGTQRLSKENRLYWLGRYTERAFSTIEYLQDAYDRSLDGPQFDYAWWCACLSLPADTYADVDDFFARYLFDETDPESAISSLNRAFDNAVMLREMLSSRVLAYLQLAKNVMDNAHVSAAPMLDLQWVGDYIMAFKGCVDEFVGDTNARMTIKCGFTIERIDMMLRLGWRTDELEKEFERLTSRLRRTSLPRDGRRLSLLTDLISSPNARDNKDVLLDCVEGLFPDA